MIFQILFWIGLVITLFGFWGIVFMMRQALRLRKTELTPEEVHAKLKKLQVVNFAAVGTAFFGLALAAAGLILS